MQACKLSLFYLKWNSRTFPWLSNTFQANPGPFLSTKTWTLHIFFLKQTLLFGFTGMADSDNEKQTVKGHFGQKSGLAKLFFPLVECYGLLASSQLHNLYSNWTKHF